jgi:hypothetical protein
MRDTFVAWEHLFQAKAFDTTQNLHFISANEIKAITKREPRIMAKMDCLGDLPDVFKRNGYFLLPVKNGNYAIVRGQGFHTLEEQKSIAQYESKIEFPLTTAARGRSEMQYLDNSYNSGTLEEVLGVGPLYQSIRGREYTKRFGFQVGETRLDVESVQIEVDSGLEGADSIVIVEAKIETPADFIIRQLFYPYRHFQEISPLKRIIPVYFTYELKSQTHNIWIYNFEDRNDYNSITPVEKHAFRINLETPITIDQIKPKGVSYKEVIPQANDLDKIIEFVFRVSEGINNYQAIANHFDFDHRQSSYYREATEALGLIRARDGRYELTEVGKQFVKLNTEHRSIFLTELLMDFRPIQAGMEILKTQQILTNEDLIDIVAQSDALLSGSTVKRRGGSLRAWFRGIS